eukprot:Sdes_comp17572_c0_seq1m6815
MNDPQNLAQTPDTHGENNDTEFSTAFKNGNMTSISSGTDILEQEHMQRNMEHYGGENCLEENLNFENDTMLRHKFDDMSVNDDKSMSHEDANSNHRQSFGYQDGRGQLYRQSRNGFQHGAQMKGGMPRHMTYHNAPGGFRNNFYPHRGYPVHRGNFQANGGFYNNFNHVGNNHHPGRPVPGDGYSCKICNVAGHWIQDCPNYVPGFKANGRPQQSQEMFPRQPPPGYICKICGVPGHFIKECASYRINQFPIQGPNPMQFKNNYMNGNNEYSDIPPAGYICKICTIPGHWLKNCPDYKPGGFKPNSPNVNWVSSPHAF